MAYSTSLFVQNTVHITFYNQDVIMYHLDRSPYMLHYFLPPRLWNMKSLEKRTCLPSCLASASHIVGVTRNKQVAMSEAQGISWKCVASWSQEDLLPGGADDSH